MSSAGDLARMVPGFEFLQDMVRSAGAAVPGMGQWIAFVTTGGKDDAHRTTEGVDIVADEAGVDIGPKTADQFAAKVAQARTVLWNGPLGRFEVEAFSAGTRKVAEALATSAAVSVVGGGDTASAVKKFGLTSRMTHVSTGGGASLEFLSGLPLPGVEALDDAS